MGDRRTSFDRRAALYDEVRPSYPQEVVEAVRARVPGGRAVEIGAGTGKATRLFAPHFDITALEPGPQLAATLRANLPAVRVVETTFEAWQPDGDYDLVYAAQAIHWIDPAVRYRRVARWLAVIRNDKAPMERADLDAVYAKHFGRAKGETPHDHAAEVTAAVGACEEHAFPWSARYTTARYLALLDTYSDNIVLPDDVRATFYADIAAAIDRRGGVIEIPYVTRLVLAESGTTTRAPRP